MTGSTRPWRRRSMNSTPRFGIRSTAGGKVIIPTFALERAQELLYHLRAGIEGGHLPPSAGLP
ncbi:MAG: hypothetical protein R2867_45660 [Caldilineaceae bacterium]